MTDKLKKDLKEFCENHGLDLRDIAHILNEDANDEAEKKLRESVEENNRFVGKAFRQKVKAHGITSQRYRYLKVISVRSNNRQSVSCLTFDEDPHYCFQYHAHKLLMPGDYFYGDFEFCPIWVESVSVRDLSDFEEVEVSLYNEELGKLFPKIINMNWDADHSKR